MPGIAANDTTTVPNVEMDLSIDLATLLLWINEGKEAQVLQYIDGQSATLQPLLDLLSKRANHSLV